MLRTRLHMGVLFLMGALFKHMLTPAVYVTMLQGASKAAGRAQPEPHHVWKLCLYVSPSLPLPSTSA